MEEDKYYTPTEEEIDEIAKKLAEAASCWGSQDPDRVVEIMRKKSIVERFKNWLKRD